MAQTGRQERAHGPCRSILQVEIPIADAMMEIPKILSFRSRPRPSSRHKGGPEVVNYASRIIAEPIPCPPETHRKVTLLSIGASVVILVHPAERQEQFAPYRDVARHHEGGLTFTGIILTEIQQPTELTRKRFGSQPIHRFPNSFEHWARHSYGARPLQHVHVRCNEISPDANIIIEEKNKVTSGRDRSGVARA